MGHAASIGEVLGAELWNPIPEHLKAIPDQVKALTGIAVQAREIDDDLRREFPDMSRAAASFEVHSGEQRITIWFDRNRAQPHSIGHELIHLRRDILESVPKFEVLQGADTDTREGILHLENELEHLFVIPEEIVNFPEAEAYWNAVYEGVVENGDDTTLFYVWTVLRLALPRSEALALRCAERIREFLGQDGCVAADAYRYEMMTARPDKLQMLRILGPRLHPETRRFAVVAHKTMRGGRLIPVHIED